LGFPDESGHREVVARLQAYMEKATREAKVHTSWLNPRPEYDAAVREFVAAALDNHPKNRFLAEFRAFHERIVRFGLYNALAQVLLKLTSPGVPDMYQGQELWDFSLVDPDNRRPVDFTLRRRLLAELQSELDLGPTARLSLARRLAENPSDPRLKLFVTWQTLRFRREHSDFFRMGHYMPLAAAGAKAEHVCAFAWRWKPQGEPLPRHVVVVVPRLIARLAQSLDPPPENPTLSLDQSVWENTHLALPMPTAAPLKNVFTGQCCQPEASTLPVAEALLDFPVAFLTDGDS
jgi:(1->4)-alpha-D-glucan 1-alpha-D-glucosylmutase